MHTTPKILQFCAAVVFLALFLTPTAQCSQTNPVRDPQLQADIDQLKIENRRNTEDIAIVRRDEINYSIEKKILEKQYDTTLSDLTIKIGWAFAAIGAVFAAVGYSSFGTARELNKEYSQKLNEANQLKAQLDAEIIRVNGLYEVHAESFARKLDELTKELENISQTKNKKIEILELAEKASQHLQLQNYGWAEYCLKTGLDIDADNLPLHQLNAIVKLRLRKYNESIDEYKWLLGKDTDDREAFENSLAEVLVFAGRFDELGEFKRNHSEWQARSHDGKFVHYLNTIQKIAQNDLAGAVYMGSDSNKCISRV